MKYTTDLRNTISELEINVARLNAQIHDDTFGLRLLISEQHDSILRASQRLDAAMDQIQALKDTITWYSRRLNESTIPGK